MIIKRLTTIAAAFAAAAFILNVPKASAYDDLKLVEDCATRYGYNYLAKCDNAEGAQRLYRDLYQRACEVWQSDIDFTLNSEGECILGIYDIREYGYTSLDDELKAILMMKYDNPVLYFVSNQFMGTDNAIYVMLDQEYVRADVRKSAQDDIYRYVTETSKQLSSETTAYGKAKALHDILIDECEYELEADNKTPSKRHGAHNVLGMIEDKSGVCDSYAKTFEMMMNYEDINCILISGYKSEARHTWDLIKMDDGRYYFFDCSADENLSHIEPDLQEFFVAAGMEKISILHTLCTPESNGVDFLYAIPEVTVTDFDPYYEPVVTDPKMGDVNGDGKIDIEDAVMVINHVNGVKVLTDDESNRADIDGNNDIDIEDAVRMISYINGVSTF